MVDLKSAGFGGFFEAVQSTRGQHFLRVGDLARFVFGGVRVCVEGVWGRGGGVVGLWWDCGGIETRGGGVVGREGGFGD